MVKPTSKIKNRFIAISFLKNDLYFTNNLFNKKLHKNSKYFTAPRMAPFLSEQICLSIAHNVSAVYDGLTARIRALRSKDQGWQTVGVVSRGNGAKRNDLGERNPEPPTGGEA
jgi:hypothetical protein